ncbi:MAG: HAD family hydrolase [Promethearchaeota archaeon]
MGLIFDFGFTLFEFKDASVEKYLNCYKDGLKKSINELKISNIIKNDQDADLVFKTFNRKRAKYFKESMKTKIEHQTTEIFKETLEILNMKNLNPKLYEKLADIYHSCEEEEWHPFEKTAETLEKLYKSKEIKLAVLSNHPHHSTIEKLLIKYDLRKYFHAVVTSAQFGIRKPDPKIFHHTLKKMGLEVPNSCMICGDEYADIMGGYRAGLQTILCKRVYEFPYEKEIIGPDYLKINNISEILDHIE